VPSKPGIIPLSACYLRLSVSVAGIIQGLLGTQGYRGLHHLWTTAPNGAISHRVSDRAHKGSTQGTFGEHSGNIQGFCRDFSGTFQGLFWDCLQSATVPTKVALIEPSYLISTRCRLTCTTDVFLSCLLVPTGLALNAGVNATSLCTMNATLAVADEGKTNPKRVQGFDETRTVRLHQTNIQ
jgi:hypothetical protein